MLEKTIPFKPSAILFNAIVAFLFWICFIIFLIEKYEDIQALMIFLVLIFLTGGFKNSLRAFFCFIVGKPAIILTPDKFIDNVSNLNLEWEVIESFNIYTYGRHTYISIELENFKEYATQIKNPFKKLIYWLNFKMTGYYLHTNIQFIGLKKTELLNSLLQYRGQAIIEKRRQNKKV